MASLSSPVSPEPFAPTLAQRRPGRPDEPWHHLMPRRSTLALALTFVLSACTVSPVPGPTSSGPTSSEPTSSGPIANEPTTNESTSAKQAVTDPAGAHQALTARAAPESDRNAASVVSPLPRGYGEDSAGRTREARESRADGERYQASQDNPVRRVAEAPVSTFSVDVDTGSWSNVRRFLNGGNLPRHEAVRVEEMINYFPYDYPRPVDGRPFAVHTAVAAAPWNPDRVLMRVAIKGEDKSIDRLPPANLVFLIDVSGSMAAPNKLALLQSSLKLLTAKLRPQDRISIITYASGTTSPLVAVPGNERARINQVIDSLRASGSTAGASGIELAYQVASQAFISDGINRILLATDGDFNVGITDFNQLKQMVETRRASGISLSALGFGTGNINEHLMEQLADAGDGAYSYIDTLMEGQKVLVTEMSSTLATIARDVKIQVEFNPAAVAEYRLIGYENRMLAREDFNNDKVDAGDVGAGHAVTALYELTPTGKAGAIDPLRYGAAAADPGQRAAGAAAAAAGAVDELAHVRIRYKAPGTDRSRLIETPVSAQAAASMTEVDADFRFAAAVAGFGQLLRGGRHTGKWSLSDAHALGASGVGSDRFGYRAEALRLMALAGSLQASAMPQPLATSESADVSGSTAVLR